MLYAPVARMCTVRLLLSVALKNNWIIQQLNIPTAFLNSKLESDVYIYPPEGYVTESKVLKLNRALCGLKPKL